MQQLQYQAHLRHYWIHLPRHLIKPRLELYGLEISTPQ
jgi:hypothetical protein